MLFTANTPYGTISYSSTHGRISGHQMTIAFFDADTLDMIGMMDTDGNIYALSGCSSEQISAMEFFATHQD